MEAHIHHPTDPSLLNDLVRVTCRDIHKADLPKSLRCRDRRRVTRKLALNIINAKNGKQRKSLYRKLLNQCQDLYQEVMGIVMRLEGKRQEIQQLLAYWLELMQRAIEQTRQRVLLDRELPAREKIVSVRSISGIIGGAVSKPDDPPELRRGRSGPAYAAAKSGVLALTRWAAKDFAKNGIWVNAIAPGACETEMTRGYDYGVKSLPIVRYGQPQDMAEAVLFLASCASNYITGQVLNVDGGWVMA